MTDHHRQTRRNTLLPMFLAGDDEEAPTTDEADTTAAIDGRVPLAVKDMIVRPPKATMEKGRAKAVNIKLAIYRNPAYRNL